ncbi:hypothetical protein HUV48_04350 [Altererythrobacter sp. HHU K3-1]|uniref:Antifreeze glycopeptide n=2 Tax=Qipengyuania atrilutea TaxID=2744473 RepID=A0A850H0U6_9SPHN|nr:hypothetical protein [Actirhodobacter atriluteus]
MIGAAGAALLAANGGLVMAQDAPTSLLPPGFGNPSPSPTAAPAPAPSPSSPEVQRSPVPSQGGAVVQPIPSQPNEASPAPAPSPPSTDIPDDLLDRLPSAAELENLSTDELDELLGLRPKFDIPPAARRSLTRVGVTGTDAGGLPSQTFAGQSPELVSAILTGIREPLVSRWGHILLRRALTSRLAAPQEMDPVQFAALRAGVLNRIGEFVPARSLVQSVDAGEWNAAMTDVAIDAYVGTADLIGICPAVTLQGTSREDAQWRMLQSICNAFAGEETRAQTDLQRLMRGGNAERIDALLAQRYAGAAGRSRRAVNVEWDGVETLTPFRYALAVAVGDEIPEGLVEGAGPYYQRVAARAPMLPAEQRLAGASLAAKEGILSSQALIDLYAQAYAFGLTDEGATQTAQTLRNAYVASAPAARMEALRTIWTSDAVGIVDDSYARFVLTAYAAARLPVSPAFAQDAGSLIAAMLSAGLDRNAIAWSDVVDDGSQAWMLLAAGAPGDRSVSSGDVDSFLDEDGSAAQRRSKFAVAALAGLGRLDEGDAADFAERLQMTLGGDTKWVRLIQQAAATDNRGMVILLAALGMQGESWERMTPRHLFHIVRSLDQVGLNAEARMIAAEAIARA